MLQNINMLYVFLYMSQKGYMREHKIWKRDNRSSEFLVKQSPLYNAFSCFSLQIETIIVTVLFSLTFLFSFICKSNMYI